MKAIHKNNTQPSFSYVNGWRVAANDDFYQYASKQYLAVAENCSCVFCIPAIPGSRGGGSLWINTNQLNIANDNNVYFSANGGEGLASGSGGRIAIWYNALIDADVQSLSQQNLLNTTAASGGYAWGAVAAETAAFGSPGTVYLWQKNQTESASSATLAIRNNYLETEFNSNNAYHFSDPVSFALVAANVALNFDANTTLASLTTNNVQITSSNNATVTVTGTYNGSNTGVNIPTDDWNIPYTAPLNNTAGAHAQITIYHNDVLGSPIAFTNEEGVLQARKEFQPYGLSDPISNDTTNTIGFTGHVEARDFGLVYMQARWYDAKSSHRFLSMDQPPFNESNPMSFNRYAYANDNPYRFVDPDGLVTRPAEGTVPTSPFGPRDTGIPGASTNHKGADYSNDKDANVVASDAGVVKKVEQNGTDNKKENSVTVENEDGSKSVYRHTDSDLKVGDQLEEGQALGQTDLSGITSGSHLHYEYYPPGKNAPVDPETHLEGANPYPTPEYP